MVATVCAPDVDNVSLGCRPRSDRQLSAGDWRLVFNDVVGSLVVEITLRMKFLAFGVFVYRGLGLH